MRAFWNSSRNEALHRLAALGGALRCPQSHPYLCRYGCSLRPSIASTDRTQSAGHHFEKSSSLPGAAAERRARRHYRLRGYRILGMNVRLAGVEVDLICRRGGTTVFCEVKEKTQDSYGDPLEMVDERKQWRLRRAAEAWLAEQATADQVVRFDVVAVRGRSLERVENAF